MQMGPPLGGHGMQNNFSYNQSNAVGGIKFNTAS